MTKKFRFTSWRALTLQAGALGGLGLAFVGGSEQPAQAGGDCPLEETCSFKKPNLLIVLDYSSSMNIDFMAGQTRWEAAVEAISEVITTDNGYFDENMHFALLRYGHDPDDAAAGTTIFGDASGITDGVSLDVEWYDPAVDPTGYFECNGEAIVDFLGSVSAPLCNMVMGVCSGIGTWTFGGLSAAQDYIATTRTDHPADLTAGDERAYFVLLMTDGIWSTQEGVSSTTLGDPDNHQDNPVPVAESLFSDDNVPVYVVAFGDAAGTPFADDAAAAGGTTASIDAGAGELVDALQSVLDDIAGQVIVPECTSGLPRIMLILDASSSMLNVGDITMPAMYAAGGMGETGWDGARDALAGMASIFDIQVASLGVPVEDLVHIGLVTWGTAGDEMLNVPFGPCMKDNIEWALDPDTSCGVGCAGPWGGPQIDWTFVGPGDAAYPGFDADTYSIMPHCDLNAADMDACFGSGTTTHAGLGLANTEIAAYIAAPPVEYPIDGSTQFINIVITDGAYQGYSTNAQVQAELTDMYSTDGITTYVIGFGDMTATAELDNMACWGSGGAGIPCMGGTINAFDAASQDELATALEDIIESLNFDPCCAFNDCSFNPEPTTGEPDPEPGAESSGGSDSGSGSGSGESGSGTTMGLTSGPTSSESGVASGESSESNSMTGSGSGSGSATESDSNTVTDSNSNSGSDTSDTNNTSGSGSNSAGSVTTPTTMTAGSVTASSDSDGDSDTEGDSAGESIDGGCGCTTGPTDQGWLFGLGFLGLLGLRRRRS